MYYTAYFIYLCVYLLWVLDVHRYFVLFIFVLFTYLLSILTLSMLTWSIKWGKLYFCLSHINPKPYCSDLGLVSPFMGLGLLFMVMFAGVITSDAVWFVITYNMPKVCFLTLLDGNHMITFLQPVTFWWITVIFPVIVCYMHPWVSCTSFQKSALLKCYSLHEYGLQSPSFLFNLFLEILLCSYWSATCVSCVPCY